VPKHLAVSVKGTKKEINKNCIHEEIKRILKVGNVTVI
jgi:hypothetical protein